LITDYMDKSTSYLEDELVNLSKDKLEQVIEELTICEDQGTVTCTIINGNKFWNKV